MTRRVIATLAVPILAGMMNAQTPSPKFEVVSVKACKEGAVPGGPGRKGAGAKNAGTSPDRLTLPCLPLRFFIQLAYIISNPRPSGLRLEGGPAWIDSERYQINAKAERPTDKDTLNGPMLQALLEDRFQLRVHRETRDVPVFALMVAKSGLKLKPWDGGSCTPTDPAQASIPPPVPGQKPWCGIIRRTENPHQVTIDMSGTGMSQFARTLGVSGRPVIDNTGITGKFDFHLEYAPQEADPSDDLTGQSIFSALGRMGLKLESTRGPRDFLVVDHVQKPSAN